MRRNSRNYTLETFTKELWLIKEFYLILEFCSHVFVKFRWGSFNKSTSFSKLISRPAFCHIINLFRNNKLKQRVRLWAFWKPSLKISRTRAETIIQLRISAFQLQYLLSGPFTHSIAKNILGFVDGWIRWLTYHTFGKWIKLDTTNFRSWFRIKFLRLMGSNKRFWGKIFLFRCQRITKMEAPIINPNLHMT